MGKMYEKLRENDREYFNANKYGGIYPNEYGEHNRGAWDLEKFRSTKNIFEILQYARSSISIQLNKKSKQHGWSVHNEHFAAALFKIVNEMYDPKSDEKLIETGFVNQTGHGTVTVYAYLDKADLKPGTSPYIDKEEAKGQKWWWVDTTDDFMSPVTQKTFVSYGYNPFVLNYKSEKQTESLTYGKEKLIAVSSLVNLILHEFPEETSTELWNYFSLTDEILESIYNEYIPNQKSAVGLIRMMSMVLDFFLHEKKPVIVYGPDVSNRRIISVGKNSIIFKKLGTRIFT